MHLGLSLALKSRASGGGPVVVPPPAGFGWAPPFAVYRDGGAFTTDYDPVAVRAGIAVNATYYVDPVAGSDANAGTEGAPFQSLYKAVHNRAQHVQVYAKPGVYDRTLAWKGALGGTAAGGYNVVLRRWGDAGRVVSSMRYLGLSWSLETGGTYKATISTAARVVDASVVDADGDYERLALQTSVATVDANPGSYWVSGTTVYVRTSDSRVPDGDVLVLDSSTSNNGYFLGGVCWMEHVDFEGGNYPFRAARSGSMSLYTNDCTFKYGGVADGGCSVAGGTLAVHLRGRCAKNQQDGFKYAAQGGYACNYAEIDCAGVDNGYMVTNVANGSSAHDGIGGVRVGGTYAGNQGRTVHDITDARSWLLGVTARDSRGGAGSNGNYAAGTGAGDASAMWLDACTSSGSDVDCEAADDATIYRRAFSGDAVDAGGGTITTY